MSKEEKQEQVEEQVQEQEETSQEEVKEPTVEEKFSELNDKHLRLHAEFENFKRRTAKERIELYKTAGEDVLTQLLPVLDDFERAIKAKTDSGEELSEDEGVLLIYNKMKSTLGQKGLKEMDNPVGEELNTDFHEAITKIPAPSEEMKGKIIDVIEKGYFLNDKVIRYAKVVVANNE
jgi:molecular chaperone GrpE